MIKEDGYDMRLTFFQAGTVLVSLEYRPVIITTNGDAICCLRERTKYVHGNGLEWDVEGEEFQLSSSCLVSMVACAFAAFGHGCLCFIGQVMPMYLLSPGVLHDTLCRVAG